MNRYETITGRHLDLGDLNRKEREALRSLQETYQAAPDWEDFSTYWQRVLEKTYPKLSAAERSNKLLYDIAQDLEMRLGIQQGKVAPPDYRDSAGNKQTAP